MKNLALNQNNSLFSLLLFIFLGIQSVFATDYYCDPVNGSMSNDGSQSSPWSSLDQVFSDKKQFVKGDQLFLLSGNHGDVIVIGINESYIKINGVLGETPVINSIVFGSENEKASKWTFSNIHFKGSVDSSTVYVFKNSAKIRLLSNYFSALNGSSTAIEIHGNQCKIESNIILNNTNGIKVFGQKNQVRNNRIEDFGQNAIEISGDYNLFEYNLVKESVASDSIINNGFYFGGNDVKGNVIRGNAIINFVKVNRDEIGLLNGIFSDGGVISETVIENNLIVSNGSNGISMKGEIINSKIINNTVVNPYFGFTFSDVDKGNTPLSIKVEGGYKSTGNVIRNNLANQLDFKNVKGIADHNMQLPVKVHEYDLCFKNWALFDFALSKNSKALNNGTSELAPKYDANLNLRSIGNFVNIGAFEFTKINEANETFVINAEISDRQIHSKGKGDWDGQPQIRVGGTGEGIDGAGVFPFELPLIPGGKVILGANFKVYLKKVDNKPEGGIDVYGLPPKSNYWVTEDTYYQGIYGQDLKARPLQNNFVDSDDFGGEIKMNGVGKSGLKSYLETVFENGSKAGDYIFLRMNPSSTDVVDYHRWNFASANSEKKERRPKLEITVGYPALNKRGITNLKEINNIVVAAASVMNSGNFNLHFLGFDEGVKCNVSVFSYKGEEVFKEQIIPSELVDNDYFSNDLELPTGKYILQYAVGETLKKQAMFIW